MEVSLKEREIGERAIRENRRDGEERRGTGSIEDREHKKRTRRRERAREEKAKTVGEETLLIESEI